MGKLNWENISVVGDSVRWSEVLPNVDVTVRYIHDILKVDVRLKMAFMRNLREQVKSGALDVGEFLTARFEIPQALVTSHPMQNGEARDLYAEPVSVDQPLYFEKNGKSVHKLRPVETYILDAKGDPIEDRSIAIQTAQQWRLSQEGPGAAEMSANLRDLANAPDGDVVIDPSMVFSPGEDTMLKDNTVYGSYTTCNWVYNSRLLFAFDVSSLGSGKSIASAMLHLYENSSSVSSGATSTAYKVTSNWDEIYATWSIRAYYLNWTTQGGDYDSNCYSPSVTLPTTAGKWIAYNVTTPFNSHYSTSINDVNDKGFLLKSNVDENDSMTVVMRENIAVYLRPRLSVVYRGTMFGADVGHAHLDPVKTPHPTYRIGKAANDNLKVVRVFEGGVSVDQQAKEFSDFALRCKNLNMKIILVFQPATYKVDNNADGKDDSYGAGASAFLTHITNVLTSTALIDTPVKDYIVDGTIVAIQIGNEEEGKWGWHTTGRELNTGLIYYAGRDYTPYYLAARDYLKTNWPYLDIIGGCIEDSKSLSSSWAEIITPTIRVPSSDYVPTPYWKSDNGKASYAFLNGFVQEVMARQTPGPSTDKLPDIIDIHGYTGKAPPEFTDDFVPLTPIPSPTPPKGSYDWSHRLDQLQDIFDFYNYSPRYSVTEWGFSVSPTKVTGCNNASKKTQAVYYVRRALIDATMRRDRLNPITPHLDCSVYWQHYYNVDDSQGDTQWYDDTLSTIIRPIQQVGSVLHDASQNDRPGLQGAYVWKPAFSTREQINGYDSTDNTMYCGWTSPLGIRWGAAWRYRWNEIVYWIPAYSQQRTFELKSSEIPASFTPGPAYLYKFEVPVTPPPTPSPLWKKVSETPIIPTPSGGNYYYHIPASYVDENPVFLKFNN